MFGLDENKWKELEGINTSREIFQQPILWKEVAAEIKKREKEIKKFVDSKLEEGNIKIIFTGAGTSAYVGDIAVAQLNKEFDINFQAIATTDIVSNPEIYFKKNTPTVLVSFARSGNSPESIAVYDLANKLVENISHIFITCNSEGELAKISKDKDNILLILMPDLSNDKGFAMTSSFSCMTLAALLIFDLENIDKNLKEIEILIREVNIILNEKYNFIDELLENNFERIVYLGSGSFYGLAKESSLKILELTRGQIVTLSENVLGFRHGPKSILNDETVVVIFISNDIYSKKYDVDMLKEIYHNEGEHKIIAVSNYYDSEIENNSDGYLYFNGEELNNNGLIALLYGVFSQILALKASIKNNVEPDNPNPKGLVNRVVQGVNIYEYK